MASKTKIYIVLEFVDGGELFDEIVSNCCLNLHNWVAQNSFFIFFDSSLMFDLEIPLSSLCFHI